MAGKLGFNIDDVKVLAVAAGASYRLSRIELIHKERFDEFMKHIYKVPGTNKQVQKKFVRTERVQLSIALVIIGL